MTKFSTLSMSLLAALLMLSAVPEVDAQGINFGFRKGRRGKQFGLNINLPVGRRHHRPQRRVICPPPVVHHHSNRCRRWIPGQVQIVHDRVWVPGCSRRIWVAPVYHTQYDACGNPVQVLAQPGHYKTIQDAGHYEVRERRVQGQGHWQYSCGH